VHGRGCWTQAVGKGFTEVVKIVLRCVQELSNLLSILPDGDDVIRMDYWCMDNDVMKTIGLKSLCRCGRGGCHLLHAALCNRNIKIKQPDTRFMYL
jgi:hypothetical protein